MHPLSEITQQILGHPFEWINIPAGDFWMGSDRQQDKYARNNEPGMQEFYLPDYAIARYPITYAQFQKFIADPQGIGDERWWIGLAEVFKQPFEQKWKLADHPRENVNWYQAIAFCRWLSFQLWNAVGARRASPLQQHYDPHNAATWLIRLPTEAEWEKAARGTDGRIYPWGHQLDSNRTNTKESNFGKTLSVKVGHSSPYGVQDLSGNVWEWCLGKSSDLFSTPDQIYLGDFDERLLRGGSWRNTLSFARCTYRNPSPPSENAITKGFRVVCTSQNES